MMRQSRFLDKLQLILWRLDNVFFQPLKIATAFLVTALIVIGFLVFSVGLHDRESAAVLSHLARGAQSALDLANKTFSLRSGADRQSVAEAADAEWPPKDPEWLSKFHKAEEQSDVLVLPHRLIESFSEEMLGYINELDVKDPVFYDIFTDAEIYAWFRPGKETFVDRIPFYIWDDTGDILQSLACKTAAGAPEGDLRDGYQSLYTELKDHPWRTYNKDEALFYYVPVYESFLKGSKDSCGPSPDTMKAVMESIISSPQWKMYNGMNFFWASSSWRNDVWERIAEFKVLGEKDPRRRNAKVGNFTAHHVFSISATPFFEATNSHLHPCVVDFPFSPPWTTRPERFYPLGPLESYKQNRGEAFMVNRPINFFFIGQADGRSAYWTRRKAVEQLWNTTGLSMVVKASNKHAYDRESRRNEIVDIVTGCGEFFNTSEHFECLMRKSLFSLHLRGDEFSSGRLAALMGAATLPVIVMEEAADISVQGQCNVPWRDMAIFVNESSWAANATEALRQVLEPLQPLDLAKRYRLLEYYRDYSVNGLWWTKLPTLLLQEFARKCVPEAALRDYGLSRRELTCPFEERMKGQTFTPVLPARPDEDDPEPPWGEGFICSISGLCHGGGNAT